MRLLFLAMLALVTASASAAEKWDEQGKADYVSRCSSQMQAQGLPDPVASRFCICMADGMEETFGTSRYTEMMDSNPNPDGSRADREMHEILTHCQSASQ
ncbi:hypothetical protein ACT3OH_16075 [Vreelandella zhanjiangensis]|uniref:hypothetical protein n=1 Tax=Vreelandella zhanjiangensis TaxID=1121960 RepID=UPI00402AAD3A